MKVVIETKNLKITRDLRNFIEEKINFLEKFLRIFQDQEDFNYFFEKGKPRVEAWIRIGRDNFHHKKGSVFSAECQIKFPKRNLFATAKAEDLKTAITEARDELQREIKKSKEKMIAQKNRNARAFKKEFHLSSQARFWRKGRIREEGV